MPHVKIERSWTDVCYHRKQTRNKQNSIFLHKKHERRSTDSWMLERCKCQSSWSVRRMEREGAGRRVAQPRFQGGIRVPDVLVDVGCFAEGWAVPSGELATVP